VKLITKDFLTINKYSRPGIKLKGIKGVVVHWTANPKTTAKNNRDYFESLKDRKNTYCSAHYIIGLKGEIVQCIPDDEMAYHVGSKTYTQEALKRLSIYPNNCTIGIECCILDWEGRMTNDTYSSLLYLCKELLKRHNLTADDLWLHKEVVGWKDCHRWFVNHPDEWQKFKEEVRKSMSEKDDWRVKLGQEAVKFLAEEKIINNPDVWKDKMREPVENWLFFELIKRTIKKLNK